MVLRNYLELVPGVPAALHLADHAMSSKSVRDPVLGIEKPLNSLVFVVDELDGRPVGTMFGVTSEKLAVMFRPYLEGKRYINYTFVVTVHGEGFSRTHTLAVRPR